MIDLPEESKILEGLEIEAIEQEVFDSLLDADRQSFLGNREYFTLDYMIKWGDHLEKGSIL
jgi:hypothetical protein